MNPRDFPNLNFTGEKFCRHDLHKRVLHMENETKLKVLAVEENDIWCLDTADLHAFLEDDKKTQRYGSHLQMYYAYEPMDALELVVAKINSFWYRCLFLGNASPDESAAFAIDYGIKSIAKKEDVRVGDK